VFWNVPSKSFQKEFFSELFLFFDKRGRVYIQNKSQKACKSLYNHLVSFQSDAIDMEKMVEMKRKIRKALATSKLCIFTSDFSKSFQFSFPSRPNFEINIPITFRYFGDIFLANFVIFSTRLFFFYNLQFFLQYPLNMSLSTYNYADASCKICQLSSTDKMKEKLRMQ
jgi:hypothetical protein